jgi:LysM repeat protein
MKIVNKKKFVRALLILIGIIALIKPATSLSFGEITYKEVHVSKGETLWQIAQTEQKNNPYYKGKDIRYIVNNIQTSNKLTTADIYEGQILQIASY